MLTFFEYLRQRAYESVLAGAHEALQALDCERAYDEPDQTPKSFSRGAVPARLKHEQLGTSANAAAGAGGSEHKEHETGHENQVHAPRLRARPKRNGGRTK